MKKMKWIALVALALASVMLLSSCSLFAKESRVPLVETGTYEGAFTPQDHEWAQGLTGMSKSEASGSLVHFVQGDQHVVPTVTSCSI